MWLCVVYCMQYKTTLRERETDYGKSDIAIDEVYTYPLISLSLNKKKGEKKKKEKKEEKLRKSKPV
jgi:hypothetical protein